MSKSTGKEKALADIEALARKHGIEADEITAYMAKAAPATSAGKNTILSKVLSYIGGVLIFAGLGTYVGLKWDDLNSAARVLITFGPGLVAFILGVAALKDPRFVKAATPLFLIAAFLEPTGMFVFLNEYFTGDNPALASMVVFGPLTAQMGLVFGKMERTALLFFTVLYGFAFMGAAMDYVEIDDDWISFVLGLSGLMIAHAISTTRHRAVVPLFYSVFCLIMAGGAYAILKDYKPFDFALIGIAGGVIYASIIAQSRAFLVAGVLSMFGYIGYYTDEYFSHMVGWPIALIVMGFVLVGFSAFAVSLGRKISH